ncbi:ninein-like protein [Aulostomus maculatus]
MEEVEHSRYVAQLKAEFDSCDTTSTGFLDRDELTVLCRKLHLEAHLPLLLDSLLGDGHYARVNFEEFKEVLVVVLSRSLDVSTSEEDSSYLDPVVPEEEKPKFVKGAKRYGRRSRPDSQPDAALTCDSGDSSPSRTEAPDTSPPGLRRAKLRRSTSLESVESLKSDEEAGSHKDNIQPDFPTKEAPQEEDLADIRGEHTCDQVSMQQFNTQEMDLLLRTLDSRTTPTKFQNVPVCSTPVQASSLQGVPHRSQVLLEGCSLRSTSPSLLTATVGQRVLSQLDDGSGCTSPERVVALWTEEGIRKSRDILQMLDFPLEERLSLADLTLALDNELLVSGNGIHQAALISYKNEIQHLLVAVEQASQERDKAKADLDLADQRNLQLVREVDDHHANMETLNQSRIRDLEQDFRDRLTALRSQAEQESEALLQQVERERGTLQEDLRLLRVQEAELQEELCRTTQENCRLEEEVCVLKLKLTDAESSVDKLQSDLDLLLQDKFGSLDPASSGLNAEERLSEIVKEYDLQCRELQDRNDELSSELELLKSQRSSRKSRCPGGVEPAAAAVFSWTEQRSTKASNSDDSEMKRSSPYPARKELQPDQQTAVATLDGVPGAAISIQTELAVEQLKQKHEQELQQLNIQLETQVNYYERSLELMRRSMELERKDISQAFKLEISELEEQKAQAERQAEQLKEALDKLQIQLGGGGWSCEQERRMQRERAETEQNFAREIRNLVQRLSTEKEQLEAELKLKMDQEVMLVREDGEKRLSQMKQQHAEGQRHLLHQLHLERQRLQEQRGCGGQEMLQKEARVEEFTSERKQQEQQHQEEVQLLKEQVCSLQEAIQGCKLKLSESEGSIEEFRGHRGHLEEELQASGERCRELEARLEEACAQLEESITFLESQERLNQQLVIQRSAVEEELQLLRCREERLKEQLGNLQAASDSILQDREVVADNCSRLSNAFVQQQAQLTAKDQTVHSLRAELVALQEATSSKEECVCKLKAELDLLKTDRSRLIQDLKEQAMAVDCLRLELDGLREELARRRSNEECLQAALKHEESRTSKLQSDLDEEKEEVSRLSQEKWNYTQLADQLSAQIVEMEEEISTLRDHLRDLSSQLNETADLVPDLRRQLNSKTCEVDRLRAETAELTQQVKTSFEKRSGDVQQLEELNVARSLAVQLQQDLLDSQNNLRLMEEDFVREKKMMAQQLMELEKLVLVLEEVMDPASLHRTQLEGARSDNVALKERLSVLQQEVQALEDDVAKKRRELEEMEQEHECCRQEEERLHKENATHREEVLSLSSRNLQLSHDNSELSARLSEELKSVQMLQDRLASVSKEQEEGGATVLQQQAAWMQERCLLEEELSCCKDKLVHLVVLEAELSSLTQKQQWLEEERAQLLRNADEHNNKVETLQHSLLSLEEEAELLRSQLHAISQEKLGHAQCVADLQRTLQDAQSKVQQLEAEVRKLLGEKEELGQAQEDRRRQASGILQEETRQLRVQNQELQLKLSVLQVQSLDIQQLIQEQQNLKAKLNHLESTRPQTEDRVEVDAPPSLAQVQQQNYEGSREQVVELRAQLQKEKGWSQQLEEELRLQAQESCSQISVKQDQYVKAMAEQQQRTEELEIKLKGVRVVLEEKVQQLREQLAKNNKSSMLLKDVYVENAQLMKALQVTEQRQKNAEKKNFLLEEKVNALNKLLREIVLMSLAT